MIEVICNQNSASWEIRLDGHVSSTYRTQEGAVHKALSLARSLGAKYNLHDKSGRLYESGDYADLVVERPVLEPEITKEGENVLHNIEDFLEQQPSLVNASIKVQEISDYEEFEGKPGEGEVELGVVDQVRLAAKQGNRLATFLGCLLGAFVPIATYVVSHIELTTEDLWMQPMAILVLGGLIYSAKTVYQWGKLAFASALRAVGFTVLLEGVMIFSSVTWLSYVALTYLVVINAIGTGVTLALGQKAQDN